MAVSVVAEQLPEKGQSINPETKHIPAGNRLARLVSYVELGVHYQMFQGKKAQYDNGKLAGRDKPPVLHIALTFEVPNEEHTGPDPLTIATSRRVDSGEFYDALTVSEGLANGTMSRANALKTVFMKYLTALQQATGKNYPSLAQFANEQTPLMINVTNRKNKEGDKTYANMKPAGICAPQWTGPDGKTTKYEVPPTKGTYVPVFDWDAPTAEAWAGLKQYHKDGIKAALNFQGSPIEMLLIQNPELDKVMDADDGSVADHVAPIEPGPAVDPGPPPV